MAEIAITQMTSGARKEAQELAENPNANTTPQPSTMVQKKQVATGGDTNHTVEREIKHTVTKTKSIRKAMAAPLPGNKKLLAIFSPTVMLTTRMETNFNSLRTAREFGVGVVYLQSSSQQRHSSVRNRPMGRMMLIVCFYERKWKADSNHPSEFGHSDAHLMALQAVIDQRLELLDLVTVDSDGNVMEERETISLPFPCAPVLYNKEGKTKQIRIYMGIFLATGAK